MPRAAAHRQHLYSDTAAITSTVPGGRQLHPGTPPQRQPDGRVQADYHQHRNDEERERRRQEDGLHRRHPAGRNIADEGVGQRPAVARVHDVVERSRVDRKRYGRAASYQPDCDDDACRPFQTVGGLGAQRMTDGKVAFGGERGDGQHTRRGRHLGEKRLEETVWFTEAPRIRLPDGVRFQR